MYSRLYACTHRVKILGEDAIDQGGVTKEMFTLAIQQLVRGGCAAGCAHATNCCRHAILSPCGGVGAERGAHVWFINRKSGSLVGLTGSATVSSSSSPSPASPSPSLSSPPSGSMSVRGTNGHSGSDGEHGIEDTSTGFDDSEACMLLGLLVGLACYNKVRNEC